MNLTELTGNIHWLAVILLTLFSFALGALWHSTFLFGKAWKKENYPGGKEVKVNAPLVFGGTALLHFIALAALSAVFSGKGALTGLEGGIIMSLVWIVPSMGATYLFAGRSLKLLFIDSGMYLFLFAISGLVLGAW